jgi:filamentous hemagglutinin family protein
MRGLRSGLLGSVACLVASGASADVVTDGSLGPRLRLSGPDVEVGVGLGTTKGRNLFHSFERFDVTRGGSVTFTGPGGLDNVISRVTGGVRSRIDGTLRSTVPGADLYLLNPSGVVFGPGGTIDVPASFHVGTADRLRLADGAELDTGQPTASGLGVAAPEAFGFLGAGRPGAVDVNDTGLLVGPGRTLDLVAGDIRLRGGVLAVGQGLLPAAGTLRLAAQRAAGEVPVVPAAEAVPRDGSITLAPGSVNATSGVGLTSNGGTRIRLEGGRIVLVGSLLSDVNQGLVDSAGAVEVAAGSLVMRASGPDSPAGILVTPFGLGRGTDVRIAAEEVRLDASGIFSSPFGPGGGGDITVDAGRVVLDGGIIGSPGIALGAGASGVTTVRARGDITLRNEAQINSSALGGADAGVVRVAASGTLRVDNSLIASESLGQGDAGLVDITAARVQLVNEGRVRSVAGGGGAAGDIRITAGQLLIDSTPLDHEPAFNSGINAGADAGSSGAAGSITVRAGDIRLIGRGPGEAEIAASTRGAGSGGNIRIEGAERLLVDSSFIGSGTASPFDSADAGSVSIEAESLELRGGGRIFNGTSPVTDDNGDFLAFGLGDGGDIEVRAGRIRIDGAVERPVAFATGIGADANPLTFGRAGDIRISARELEIRNDGQIASDTLGAGPGGEVTVEVAAHLRIANGLIGASTTSLFDTADAGTVRIAAGSLELRDGGRVFNGTSPVVDDGNLVALGAGDGGDVIVDVRGDLRIDGTEGAPRPFRTGISASANPATTGAAGDVRVTADRIDLIDAGDISSGSSGSAAGGDVTVTAPAISLRRGGQIEAAGLGTGNAGTIRITAAEGLDLDGGLVSTESTVAGGGRIVIRAGKLLQLDRGAAIVSSVQGDATTTAGDIAIDPRFVVLNRGSRIVAQANEGRGGNIRIDAGRLVASIDSAIDASAATGISGTVVTTSPEVDLTSGLVVLPTAFLGVDNLVQESCDARGAERLSSFTARGRGGQPPSPEQPLVAGYGAAGGTAAGAGAADCGG